MNQQNANSTAARLIKSYLDIAPITDFKPTQKEERVGKDLFQNLPDSLQDDLLAIENLTLPDITAGLEAHQINFSHREIETAINARQTGHVMRY